MLLCSGAAVAAGAGAGSAGAAPATAAKAAEAALGETDDKKVGSRNQSGSLSTAPSL